MSCDPVLAELSPVWEDEDERRTWWDLSRGLSLLPLYVAERRRAGRKRGLDSVLSFLDNLFTK